MMEEMRELFQLKEENSQSDEEDIEVTIYKKLQYTKIAMGSCVCILTWVIMIELRR